MACSLRARVVFGLRAGVFPARLAFAVWFEIANDKRPEGMFAVYVCVLRVSKDSICHDHANTHPKFSLPERDFQILSSQVPSLRPPNRGACRNAPPSGRGRGQ